MQFRFTKHALERMFERDIESNECILAFEQGNIVEDYPDDTPFPSQLRIGPINGKIIHVVGAISNEIVHIITVYEPTSVRWTEDYMKRRN